jgi:uncharacterized integral membrane protein
VGDRLMFVTDGMLERDAERMNITAILTAGINMHPREAVQHLTQAVLQASAVSYATTRRRYVSTGTAALPATATPLRELTAKRANRNGRSSTYGLSGRHGRISRLRPAAFRSAKFPTDMDEESRPEERAAGEPRRDSVRRHARHTWLYTWASALVALLVILIALVVANTRTVKVSWVLGSTRQSLVWIILVTAILAWLLGIVTSVIFRFRTRRRNSAP